MDLTGFGAVSDLAKTIINKIFPDKFSDAEKAGAELQLQTILLDHEQSTISAQRDIIVAEMAQTDPYTKRARPTIVYAGLAFILVVHVIFPIAAYTLKADLPTLALPDAFWYTWGGVCGVWIFGRSYEKVNGVSNLTSGLITGSK